MPLPPRASGGKKRGSTSQAPSEGQDGEWSPENADGLVSYFCNTKPPSPTLVIVPQGGALPGQEHRLTQQRSGVQ